MIFADDIDECIGPGCFAPRSIVETAVDFYGRGRAMAVVLLRLGEEIDADDADQQQTSHGASILSWRELQLARRREPLPLRLGCSQSSLK